MTTPAPFFENLDSDTVKDSLTRAVSSLFDKQHSDGWWKGELETNVTMDAEDLFLREFLGISESDTVTAAANWIRSKQREDGTWSNFFAGTPDLSTTVEAYWALKLAGDSVDAPHMKLAASYIVESGGLERTRVFTRIWMALFGLWDWDELPAMPPEVILLPSAAPLNIYNFSCWARQTVVPITVLAAHRPVRPMRLRLDELRVGVQRPELDPDPEIKTRRRFQQIDRVLNRYEQNPIGPLRRKALRRAEQWIIRRQEADGSWGGIQPPWVYSIMALNVLGYDTKHPVIAKALDGLDTFTIWDSTNDSRRLEACQSPVWDTALSVVALVDAGVEPNDTRIERATRWLLDKEISDKGDWGVRRPDLPPGGWAFEFHNNNYPDVDDAAEVVLALDRVRDLDCERIDNAISRAVLWINGMQCKNGGFGAFDVDNDNSLVAELPFCDFGEVTDPPSADVTAHALEMFGHLSAVGRDKDVDSDITAQTKAWLSAEQQEDGSWFGRWGANHIYGTGAAVPALVAAGVGTKDSRIERALNWLTEIQNADGGWGEDLRSYQDDEWRGKGESTPSQTAWALMALLAGGCTNGPVTRGLNWLIKNQRADGSWDEPYFTGTGFPGDFYINYHLYRLVFPITALGRYLQLVDEIQPNE